MPFMTIDPQDALASLRQWQLEQDNSGRFRVYRDQHGQIYHSVTHILKNTAPQSQKDALERWAQRAGSALERDLACNRGTVAHEHCEYVLKQPSWLDRAPTRKVHGRSGMMAWLDLQRRSPAGHLRKRRKAHRKLHGQPVSTPEVYPTGW